MSTNAFRSGSSDEKKAQKREMFDDPVPLDETDPEVREEMFETFKDMDWKPEDITDDDLRGPYTEWLKKRKES